MTRFVRTLRRVPTIFAVAGAAVAVAVTATAFVVFQPASGNPDAFVEACGVHFCVDEEPVVFVGANVPDLALAPAGSSGADVVDEAGIERRLDDLAGLGVDLVRVRAASHGDGGAFPEPGVFVDDAVSAFDVVLASARERGIRVVAVLEDAAAADGAPAVLGWEGGAAGAADGADAADEAGAFDPAFFDAASCSGCDTEYLFAAESILEHVNPRTGLAYRDDPTILGWDLVSASPTPAGAQVDGAALREWTHRVVPRLRALDSRHLLTLGFAGDAADAGVSYLEACANRYVDFCSAQLFPTEQTPVQTPAEAGGIVTSYVATAHDVVGKPFLLGAFNAHANVRAGYWTAVYRALDDAGADGSAFWAYQGSGSRGTYDVLPGDAELEIVRAHREALDTTDALASGERPRPTGSASVPPSATPTPVPTPTPTPSPTPTPTPAPPALPPPAPAPAPEAVPAGGCLVAYGVDDWGSGFNANLSIVNVGAEPIGDWSLTFHFPADQRVEQSWGAEVTQAGSTVTAAATSWNAGIAAGGTVSFGFSASAKGGSPALSGFALNGVPCDGG